MSDMQTEAPQTETTGALAVEVDFHNTLFDNEEDAQSYKKSRLITGIEAMMSSSFESIKSESVSRVGRLFRSSSTAFEKFRRKDPSHRRSGHRSPDKTTCSLRRESFGSGAKIRLRFDDSTTESPLTQNHSPMDPPRVRSSSFFEHITPIGAALGDFDPKKNQSSHSDSTLTTAAPSPYQSGRYASTSFDENFVFPIFPSGSSLSLNDLETLDTFSATLNTFSHMSMSDITRLSNPDNRICE